MKVSPEILNLIPYKPGKPIGETQREYGLNKVYKLASNENALGPSPKALAAIKGAIENLARYPDPSCFELLNKVSAQWGFPISQLAVGNGSDEILDLLIRIYCEPGEGILIPEASFAAYEVSAQAARVRVYKVPLNSDYSFNLKALSESFNKSCLKKQNIHLIFIANPNNPTGTLSRAAELDLFMGTVGNREDVLIVFDEAYTEFVRDAEYRNAFEYFKKFNNVIVLRTFSKVYGLAGLRVGIMVAPESVIELFNRVRKPFNVNELAQVAAGAALFDVEFIRQSQKLVWSGLDYFYKELSAMGLNYIPSQANFVTFDTQREALKVFEALLKRGVILRPLLNYGFKHHLRMTVGLSEENEVAIKALREVLEEIPPLENA